MRVFALSDLHVDYGANARWLEGLPEHEFGDDLLILAGDISDSLERLEWALRIVTSRFRRVMFVPGNHDLWVIRDKEQWTSVEKFERVQALARECGVATEPVQWGAWLVVPLLGWYDHSFGVPGSEISTLWMDYRACVWPKGFGVADIVSYFIERNEPAVRAGGGNVISFSHFLPRIDVMPARMPPASRIFYPVMGTSRLEQQVRRLGSKLHVYGHSHVNQRVTLDGVDYVNNAFGYPWEKRIAARALVCVHG
jgi:predicted phosphodiesterase